MAALDALAIAAAPLDAANVSWTLVAGQSGNWSTGGDWSSLSPPQSTDTAYVADGGTANVTLSGSVFVALPRRSEQQHERDDPDVRRRPDSVLGGVFGK